LATCPETGPEAQAFLLDHFEKAWLNGRSPTSSFVIPNYPTTFQSATDTRFLLVVRTEEPLLIARRAEAGNQFEGVSIIPGIVVKGAFAWLAVRRYGLSRYHKQADVQTLPAYKDFNQVFRRGGVQFPYLYPARYAERQLFPAIPAPLDLLTCKLFPGFTSQRMHGVFPAGNTDCPTCGEHLQPLGGFVTLEGIRRLYQSELRYEMHIRINPESGRVRQGDLYSYVSIEAGQYFVGELESGDGQNWARFLELSGATVGEPFTLHLGKANRRGYGRVTAWLQPLPPIAGEPSLPLIWIQSGIQARVPAPDGTISLLFLTDTVLPDRWGRYPRSVASDSTWLSDWLGLPIEALDCFTQVKSVDGFNSHLGLPQWQDMAFAAGSVVHLKRPSATTWPTNWQDQLVNLEREGIGLRRDEGFGRIAFNHPIYQSDGTIGPSAIQLPESLALGGVTGEHSFTEDWQKKLDEQRKSLEKLCQGTPSAAVSRWLYANRTRSPNELQTQLSSLGVPDDTLIQAVGKAEYGARDKANRLIQKPERVQANDLTETERQKEGLGLLYTLLNELAAHSPVHWPNGISLLADAIANVNKDQEVTK
jgi:CRISPR-associated protein Csx10